MTKQCMKIRQKFNLLTYQEYIHIIDNHNKFSNFNTLGLFRSIVETKKLDINEKIAIRDYANQKFYKTFVFLQLKDPKTYFDLKTLGENLTAADEAQIWREIKLNQEQILKDKKLLFYFCTVVEKNLIKRLRTAVPQDC